MVALALAMALVFSAVAPFAFATSAAALPSGLVGVPDSNVSEDVPVGSKPAVRATELQGSVMASEHAETLEVVITTPERARDYLAASGANVGGAGESGLSLVLRDDVHSQGRTVAIDAGAVRQALGYTPEQVYGTHEDGSEWSSRVSYEGGLLVFEVPHFSSNVVEFSGTVELSATPASDGTTLTYDVSDYDSVANLDVNVTGAVASEWDNETASGLSPSGGTASIAVGGNVEPVGPGGDDPEVSITGHGAKHYDSTNSTETLAYNNDYTRKVVFNDPPDTITAGMVPIDWTDNDNADNAYLRTNIYLAHGDTTGQSEIQGTKVDSPDVYYPDDLTYSTSGFNASGDDQVTVAIEVWDSNLMYSIDLQNADMSMTGQAPTNVTVDTDTGQTADLGSDDVGRLDIQPDTSQLTFTAADGAGTLDYTVSMQERQTTVDPAVEVNGQWANHSGTLADGETVSLPANESWVQEGTNRVNVSVGTVDADAPAPVVDVSYTHDALDEQTVTYEGEKWTERYNVSKTFASSRSATSLTIPFVGNVYRIRDVETRVNGSSWSDVPTDEYDLSNTTLTVQTGAVDAGTTVEVRANGSRLAVTNASITVTEPTLKGERLDSEIVLDSWGSDSYLSVGGTPDGRRIHYTYEETWTADEHSTVLANGVNRLHLPNAATNDVFRVSTIPVRVNVASNEAEFSVETASTTEPTFHVDPGTTTGDSVSYTFVDAQDETSYVLWSETDEIARDSGTANSPLTLEDDDSEETLTFKLDDDGASSAGDDGGAASWWSEPASTASGVVPAMPIANPALIALLVLGVIGGAIYYTDRRPGFSSTSTPFYRRPIVLFATALAFALAILLISPETVTHPLRVALEASLPIASILGVLIALGGVAYWLWTRRKARVKEAATPDTVLRLGGRDD
jgi:hypothetical protein